MKMNQQTPEAASAAPSPSAFVPYQAGAPQRDGGLLMVEAYAVAWVIIMVFVLLAHLRQRRLDQRITRLEAAMDRAIERAE